MDIGSTELKSPYFSILSYMREIELLTKWKVIPLGSLHQILPSKIHKTYSYRLADQLVKNGAAHKIKCLQSNFQVLIPTDKALGYSFQNFKLSLFHDYCRHAFIAAALLELPVFSKKALRFQHEDYEEGSNGNCLEANISIEGTNSKSVVYHMGIFFEPPHYSKKNTIERMFRFLEKENYNVIILIFSKFEDLEKRRELYFENRDHKHGKMLKEYICLVYIEDYLRHPHEINKSYVYFQGEETTLEKLF
jgi:hypothetical protein